MDLLTFIQNKKKEKDKKKCQFVPLHLKKWSNQKIKNTFWYLIAAI